MIVYFLPIFVTSSSIINQHKRYKCYISSDQYGWTSVTIDPCFCFTSSDFFGISKFLFINYMTEHLWLSVGKCLFFLFESGISKVLLMSSKNPRKNKKEYKYRNRSNKERLFHQWVLKEERSMSILLTKKRDLVCCLF